MANAIQEGANSVGGISVEVKYFVRPEELTEADVIAFGIPTYYHDMSIDIKNLIEATSKKEIT